MVERKNTDAKLENNKASVILGFNKQQMFVYMLPSVWRNWHKSSGKLSRSLSGWEIERFASSQDQGRSQIWHTSPRKSLSPQIIIKIKITAIGHEVSSDV